MKIAFLIDGDNASPYRIESALKFAEQYGTVTIRRIYGDWSLPNLNRWKSISNRLSIRTVHAYNYTKGKNSTDIAMVIDAMDILNQGVVDAFCLVSSDCDFTALVHRIRENGLFTIGFGKHLTCNAFQQACHAFGFEEDRHHDANLPQMSDLVQQIATSEQIFKAAIPEMPGVKVVGKIDLEKIK